jgi:hypothetical protein
VANPVIKIVSLDTVERWITINSDSLPAEGAMPIWDGTQLVWSAIENIGSFEYLRPGGVDTYLRPDGVSTYLR